MKKIISLAAAVVSAVSVFCTPQHTSAHDYCGLLTYSVSDNKVTITGYKGNPETLVLPAQIDGIPVTEIRENAFYKCETLKKVSLPQSITKLGNYSFFGCTSLITADLGCSAAEIPDGAFYGCCSLETISFGKNLKVIDDYAFYGCESIEQLSLPDSITDIGEYGFAECKNLSSAELGGNLVNIGSYSFYNCPSLSRIDLPESILSMGQFSIGFSENKPADIVVTGKQDSIAEKYAQSSGLRFKSRIRYDGSGHIDIKKTADIISWSISAAVYVLLMMTIHSVNRRKHFNSY